MKLMSRLWQDGLCSVHGRIHSDICWQCLRVQADTVVLLVSQEEFDKMQNLSVKDLGGFLQENLVTRYPASQKIANWLRQISLVSKATDTDVHQVFTLLHFAAEYNFNVRLIFREEEGVLEALSYILMLIEAGFLETPVDGDIQAHYYSAELSGLSELEIDITFTDQFDLFALAQQIYLFLDSIAIL